MKTFLLTIAFTLSGVLTSIAQSQVIPMTIDSTQSIVTVSVGGAVGTSQLSGNATLDLENSNPPSGNAQITDLNLVFDEGINVSFSLGLLGASTSPGDVSISMVTPGSPGTISGTSFNQLANMLNFGGDLEIVDSFGIAGGSQTVDLSTVAINPVDFSPVVVTQSGNVITLTSSFNFTGTLNLGVGPVPIIVTGTYVATGDAPATELPGDVNQDGTVDALDISPFIWLLITREFQSEADLTEDGAVTYRDIFPFVTILTSP